jgi:hypothetical protein
MNIFFPFIFGIILGIVVKKANLCVYEALTTAFIIKNYRGLKILILAILTGTIGFNLLAYFNLLFLLPQPFSWWGNILGGILFGIGVVLVGGCMFGIFLKVSSGFLNYFLGFLGILLGLGLGGILVLKGPFNDYYQLGFSQPKMPAYSFPQFFHFNYWLGVILFSLILIGVLFKFKEKLKNWSSSLIGIIIGILMIIGFARWQFFSLPTFFQRTFSFNSIFTQFSQFIWLILFMMGLFLGMLIVAISLKDFRLRWYSWGREKSLKIIFGGILMGLGAVLINGCNIFHFFVFLPQLSLGSFLAIPSIIFTIYLINYFKFSNFRK